MPELDLIAVGDVMLDVVVDDFPNLLERVHGPVRMRPGGSATNAALAAAAAGARALVVGRVGDDTAAALVRGALADAGVETRLAVDAALPTGTVVVAGAGRSAIADRGANRAFCLDDLPEALDAGAVVVSGYALLQSGSGDAARAALGRANARWIAVDAASPGLADTERLRAAAAGANVLFADEEEAHALTGLAAEAAAKLLGREYELAVVKRAAAGAVAVLGGRVLHAAARHVVAVAVPGAGDAFDAVLLVELVRGASIDDALARACEAGATAAAA